MQEILIAPCGMNCSLCGAYLAKQYDLQKYGIKRSYCDGCIPRGKNCLHMARHCEKLANGRQRFCYDCNSFPCKRLKALDKRYSTRYNMSMIENLTKIKEKGMDEFLRSQEEKWVCPSCGGIISCHNGQCPNCTVVKVRRKKPKADNS